MTIVNESTFGVKATAYDDDSSPASRLSVPQALEESAASSYALAGGERERHPLLFESEISPRVAEKQSAETTKGKVGSPRGVNEALAGGLDCSGLNSVPHADDCDRAARLACDPPSLVASDLLKRNEKNGTNIAEAGRGPAASPRELHLRQRFNDCYRAFPSYKNMPLFYRGRAHVTEREFFFVDLYDERHKKLITGVIAAHQEIFAFGDEQ